MYANIRESRKHTFPAVICLILFLEATFAKKANISGNFILGLRLQKERLQKLQNV